MARKRTAKGKREPQSGAKLPLTVPRPWSVGCVGGAFEAGDAAYGMRFLRRGFGYTDDDDRLFALGFPHLVLPADVAVNLERLASKDTFHLRYYPWRGGVWSRALMERILPCYDDLSDPDTRAAAFTGEAPKLSFEAIANQVASDDLPYGDVFLYMVEALWGTSRTLQCALAAWEDVEDWREYPWEDVEMAAAVPFLLLRVTAGDRKRFRARLKKIHERIVGQGAGDTRAAAAFHIAAFGKPAKVEDEFRPWRTDCYRDPPDSDVGARLVEEMGKLRPADRAKFDGRLAFLGGDAATAALADGHARFHKTWHSSLVEQLARIRHPAIKKAMTELAAKKNADAKAWLEDRG